MSRPGPAIFAAPLAPTLLAPILLAPTLLAPTLLALVVTAAAAQPTPPAGARESAGIARCRSLADGGERLICYDGLAEALRRAAPAPAGGGHRVMSLTDVKLDQDGLRDREVEVSGNLVPMGEMAFLRSGPMDTSPLVVDSKAVPREQRRAMFERCGVSGCATTVPGDVGLARPAGLWPPRYRVRGIRRACRAGSEVFIAARIYAVGLASGA